MSFSPAQTYSTYISSDFKHKRYTVKTRALNIKWPTSFQIDGIPKPSSGLDSVIKVYDGNGNLRYYIDPPTRKTIDAITLKKVGYRRNLLTWSDSAGHLLQPTESVLFEEEDD